MASNAWQPILEFWFGGDRDAWRPNWFRPDPAFDTAIRARFAELIAPAAAGGMAGWAVAPQGALALCLLLDQFPRNLHRGTAAAFAQDSMALAIARAAVLRDRLDLALTPSERCFLYLPFEHSEAAADQAVSVALFEGLRDQALHRAPGGSIDFAWRHWRVIRDFGRFPHRNAALGRTNTAAERIYLQSPGAGF